MHITLIRITLLDLVLSGCEIKTIKWPTPKHKKTPPNYKIK